MTAHFAPITHSTQEAVCAHHLPPGHRYAGGAAREANIAREEPRQPPGAGHGSFGARAAWRRFAMRPQDFEIEVARMKHAKLPRVGVGPWTRALRCSGVPSRA
eukprot:923259-Prymnesium_polylepis.2